jgi:neutral ceramidase
LHNRRWWMKPGSIPPDPFGNTTDKVRMNPPRSSPDLIKPAGPIVPGFTVVSVRTAGGKPLALLANYSLHYVGGIPARQLSADYFGEFARQITERLEGGPEFVGILSNSTSGDSNSTSGDANNIDFQHASPRLEPFEKIRSVAGKLADSALAAYRQSQYQNQVLPLLYRKPTPEMLERARRVLAEPDEKKLPQHAKACAARVI